MHVEIKNMEWVNNLMEISMMSNYRKGVFNLMNGEGQASAFNETCEGQTQALTMALWFYACHLFGPLFDVERGS